MLLQARGVAMVVVFGSVVCGAYGDCPQASARQHKVAQRCNRQRPKRPCVPTSVPFFTFDILALLSC